MRYPKHTLMLINNATGSSLLGSHEGKLISLLDVCRYLVSHTRNSLCDDGSFHLGVFVDDDMNPSNISLDYDNTSDYSKLDFVAVEVPAYVGVSESLEHVLDQALRLPPELEQEAQTLAKLKGFAFASQVEALTFGDSIWPQHKFSQLRVNEMNGGYIAC